MAESEKSTTLTIKTSGLETTAPADVACAGIGLALGALVDVMFFPGGLTTDAVATFTSSGLVGARYAFVLMATWLKERRERTVIEVRRRNEADIIDQYRRRIELVRIAANGAIRQADAYRYRDDAVSDSRTALADFTANVRQPPTADDLDTIESLIRIIELATRAT